MADQEGLPACESEFDGNSKVAKESETDVRQKFYLLILASALSLSGCGGGGGDDGFDANTDGIFIPPPQAGPQLPAPSNPSPTPGPTGQLLAYYDTYDTTVDTELSVPSLDGVLVNDSYPIGSSFIEFPVYSLQGGYIEGFFNGGFNYRPPAGFVGEDSFLYTLSDNSGRSSTARVYLNVYR